MAEQGIVKWYSLARGYGFIRRERDGEDGGGNDVFVHHSEVGEALSEGERVSFELVDGPKGLQARKVTRISASG